MNPLLKVRPIPYEDESPASILIRAATGNGYRTVHQMLAVTGMNPRCAYLDILLAFLDKFVALITGLGLKCRDAEHTLERQGPTLRSKRRMLGGYYPYKFFRPDGVGYCPACISERSYLRKIWVFQPYTVCHIHNLSIETTCPHCSEPLKASRGEICACQMCGGDLRQQQLIPVESHAELWLHKFVQNSDNQNIEEFSAIYQWATTISTDIDIQKSARQATELAHQYFENRENFSLCLANYMDLDKRHIRLKLLPLLRGPNGVKELAANILSKHQRTKFSLRDLQTHLTLTEAALVLSVSPRTMNNLLKRNGVEKFGREETIPLRDIIKILEMDQERKDVIRQVDENDSFLTVNEVASKLNVHPEIVRSLQKSDYLLFERQNIGGSLKYITTEEELVRFSNNYVLVGTLARKLNVNSTDLTARLSAINIFPVANRSNQGLKTSIFHRRDVEFLTTADILSIEKCRTNAGRKPKGRHQHTAPGNPDSKSIVEAAESLHISIQQAKTLIEKGLLLKRLDPRLGVFVTGESLSSLQNMLSDEDYLSIKDACEVLKLSQTLLKREWISTGQIEHYDLHFWEFVKKADVLKVVELRKEYVNGSEGGALLNMHRLHLQNLAKQGLIHRHFIDNAKTIAMYKRSEVLQFKAGK